MKGKNKSLIWMLPALFVLALNMPLNAQDDIYYDPSTDSKPVPTYEDNYDEPNNAASQPGGDDQYYEDDDYAYEYSSRIRRFHQPVAATDYYDPYFVDLYHYDPYYLPGATIYTYGYNDYWRWRRWQQWQYQNAWYPPSYGPSYSVGYSPWGWSAGPAYGPWYNPYVWSNYYYDPYWTWNGHNPYYYDNCAPGNSYFFYNNHNNNYYPGNGGSSPQTYVGPRRGGTTVGTGGGGGYTRLTSGTGGNGRLLVADDKAKVVDINASPSSRAIVEKQREMAKQQVERGVPSTTASRKPATSVDPSTSSGRGQEAEKKPVQTRPSRETIPDEVMPNRRPAQQPTETRPSRPSGGGDENVRPSRPSSDDRPSRTSSGGTETRPSRSSGNDGGGKSLDAPSRSSSGNSGSSGSGSSSGGSKSSGSSGGGKSGRN